MSGAGPSKGNTGVEQAKEVKGEAETGVGGQGLGWIAVGLGLGRLCRKGLRWITVGLDFAKLGLGCQGLGS